MSILLFALTLLGYFLPFVINPGGGLTLHALDLAEWTTLHPLVRAETPLLLTALLLRLPLLCAGIMITLQARSSPDKWSRRIGWLCAGSVVLGLLPPLDFVTQLNNINYQQQFVLALVGLMSLGISIFARRQSVLFTLTVIAGVTGITGGIIGWLRAATLLRNFGIPTSLGAGGLLMVFGFAAWIAWVAIDYRRSLKMKQGSALLPTTLLS